MKKFWSLLSVIVAFSEVGFAQFEPSSDSAYVMPLQDFIGLVLKHHPVANQAALIPQEGKARRLMAKGSFDPVAFYFASGKEFNNKNYYSYQDGGLEFFTYPGIKFNATWSTTGGDFLNPESNMPIGGLLAIGADIPVLRGLLTDQRRLALQQANLFNRYSAYMQRRVLNDLLFEAIADYWMWSLRFAEFQMRDRFVKVARQRFELVKTAFLNGDVPAVDTLEAFILIQSREIAAEQARAQLNDARLKLSNHLWSPSGEPLELSWLVIPQFLNAPTQFPVSFDSIIKISNEFYQINPESQLLDYQVRLLEAERAFRKNELLPKLNIKYNFLTEQVGFLAGEEIFISPRNYKFGIDFSIPLFLRRERAALRINEIRLTEARLQRENRRIALQRRMQQEAYLLENQFEQMNMVRNNMKNFFELLRIEQRKFQIGESSLFLVNAREVQAIDAELQYLQLLHRYQTSIASFFRAAGILYDYTPPQ
ncbi:TolC family protein [Thermaurantimonas aggregans]|uniref:TolC family protein n=1 Tax=Thermaurantimonas aggregans TaxID=2173829 RepID=UPI0023F44B31|nr:TolC family protein [Thermaurantimonas aggregans]MCX8148514.1 TolC family protein [Thermaurantimonas aggregans]